MCIDNIYQNYFINFVCNTSQPGELHIYYIYFRGYFLYNKSYFSISAHLIFLQGYSVWFSRDISQFVRWGREVPRSRWWITGAFPDCRLVCRCGLVGRLDFFGSATHALRLPSGGMVQKAFNQQPIISHC